MGLLISIYIISHIYYIILYYIILCYIILYYIILYHIILYYIILFDIISYQFISYYIILYTVYIYISSAAFQMVDTHVCLILVYDSSWSIFDPSLPCLEMGVWEPLLAWDIFSMQFVNQLVAGSSNKIQLLVDLPQLFLESHSKFHGSSHHQAEISREISMFCPKESWLRPFQCTLSPTFPRHFPVPSLRSEVPGKVPPNAGAKQQILRIHQLRRLIVMVDG